ncbi:MAG: tetratricopeptide repeat protein, partial [Acidobacteria bacterium]|nr:tetratricopeptide repeat protein [Acidobacteriota bacterium]
MTAITEQDSSAFLTSSATELSKLLVLINSARRGFWTFAIYNAVAPREEVIETVKRTIAPLPVFDWTYSPENSFPASYLQSLTEEQKRSRAVIFFFDLERGGAEAWKSLDYSREMLASHPHALVFWTTSKGRADAARKAPHFWAQRSGVLDFTISLPAEQQRELMGSWAGQPVEVATYADAERQLRLFQGLLDEYRALPNAPLETIAELDGKVAALFDFLDRREEAIPCLEEQIEIARQLNRHDLEAEALTNLAIVERIRTGRPRAIELLEQALTLAPPSLLQARIKHNLGAAIYLHGESDRSLALLNEALKLFKQVGDNLGQANVLQAIGDVQSFRKEMDAALDSYDSALKLFKQVDDNLGQANVLKAIGDVY